MIMLLYFDVVRHLSLPNGYCVPLQESSNVAGGDVARAFMGYLDYSFYHLGEVGPSSLGHYGKHQLARHFVYHDYDAPCSLGLIDRANAHSSPSQNLPAHWDHGHRRPHR